MGLISSPREHFHHDRIARCRVFAEDGINAIEHTATCPPKEFHLGRCVREDHAVRAITRSTATSSMSMFERDIRL